LIAISIKEQRTSKSVVNKSLNSTTTDEEITLFAQELPQIIRTVLISNLEKLLSMTCFPV
jgi:cysteine sulfinate desulfinase/cysteine desulfurase-like protein